MLKKLFGSKDDKVPSLAQLAELMKPDNIDPRSDYALTSSISSHIDAWAVEKGPNALDNVYIILFGDGTVGSSYSEKPMSKGSHKAIYCLKDYPMIKMLKTSAGKRDDMSYMTVDIAGRDILNRLREQGRLGTIEPAKQEWRPWEFEICSPAETRRPLRNS